MSNCNVDHVDFKMNSGRNRSQDGDVIHLVVYKNMNGRSRMGSGTLEIGATPGSERRPSSGGYRGTIDCKHWDEEGRSPEGGECLVKSGEEVLERVSLDGSLSTRRHSV